MKISFNDKSLQTTFEYPAESSLQEEEAEEEEEGDVEEDAEASGPDGVPEKHLMLFLPRATFVSSVGPESPRLPDGSSSECLSGRAGGQGGWGCPGRRTTATCPPVWPAGLSSYTPKHSVAFSKWPEQVLERTPSVEEAPPKEVMVSRAGWWMGTQGRWERWGNLTPGRALDCLHTTLSSPPPVRTTYRTSEVSQPSTSDLPPPDQHGQG